MPAFVCEVGVRLDSSTKAEVARPPTEFVNKVILSDLDLISVISHDLPAESTFRAGVATPEAVIFGDIRARSSSEAISQLAFGLSRIWSEVTGMSEAPGRGRDLHISGSPFTFRYGACLPEPSVIRTILCSPVPRRHSSA